MSDKISKIKVGGEQYNCCQASAVKQRELLSILGPMALIEVARSGKDIDHNMVVGCLLMMGSEKLDQVADIVLYKTIKNGGESTVDIEDFQGKMSVYMELVAKSIIWNLEDFFGYLSSASKS